MTVPVLPSYVLGNWETGTLNGHVAHNAVTGEPIVVVSSDGFDYVDILRYGRASGAALRQLSLHERANIITALAKHLNEIKKKYYAVSMQSGATFSDSCLDVDGGINTLFAMSSLARRGLPDGQLLYEPGVEMLSRSGNFVGKHLLVPKHGVALLINAFNFPCWGMLEKLASCFIAGVPAIVKPASVTAYVAQAMMEDMVTSGLLPAGSLQMVNGGLGNALDHLQELDTVSLTGSATTATALRRTPAVVEKSVAFFAEADSLNFAMLSAHAKAGDGEFNACVDEIVQELSIKAGQRCTCIRRIFVARNHLQALSAAVIKKLKQLKIGQPDNREVNMGALVSTQQRKSVQAALEQLLDNNELLYSGDDLELLAADPDKGAFFTPHLLLDENKLSADNPTHNVEAFGPVAVFIPYDDLEGVIEGIGLGRGSLTGSIYSNNAEEIRTVVSAVATWHGRINLINARAVPDNTGHGNVMPQMVHGGPGRAGGGEELGGIRGIKHYMQRVGVQGDPTLISAVCGDWLPQADTISPPKHPFKMEFEELMIGYGITTHRRTVSEADIVNYSNVSWDHYYAHTDEIAAKRSIFGQRVAHGYFVISAAAGLFVDPGEGPVLANVGIDTLRFIAPVFVGDTIHATLTCKEKTIKPHKEKEKPPFGEVKWQVQVFNQEDAMVADLVIVTLVRRQPDE